MSGITDVAEDSALKLIDTLKKAANAIWPEAELTNSGIVLGLAKLGAREILKKKGKKG